MKMQKMKIKPETPSRWKNLRANGT